MLSHSLNTSKTIMAWVNNPHNDPSSSRIKRTTSAHPGQFSLHQGVLESEDPSTLASSLLGPYGRDQNSALLGGNNDVDFENFLETTEPFLPFEETPNANAIYSSAGTSAASSPAGNLNRIKPESPNSQRSSFSLPKNTSNSSSQTSIANQMSNHSSLPERKASEALANYQFGRELYAEDPTLPDQPSKPIQSDGLRSPPAYMPNFNANDWNNTSNLKYGLQIQDVPSKSRVETQIKVVMNFYPPPSESIVHLPTDTISKPKLQLRSPFTPIPSALSVDTIVVCESDHSQHVNICQGCIKRERKRAFRKKILSPTDEAHWRQDKEKRAIVFNCREVLDFGPLVNIVVDGKTVKSQQIELPMRMACYCRHHNEKLGFRALFVVSDYLGRVVARGSSRSIMITDDHKAANLKTSIGMKRPNPGVDDDILSPSPEADPPRKRTQASRSPSFVSHSQANSRPNTTLPSPRFSPAPTPNLAFTPISTQTNDYDFQRTASLDSLSMLMSRPVSAIHSPQESPAFVISPVEQFVAAQETFPNIKRIIPSSGSIRGGIEVTLLGEGFINGLVAKFGESKSVSTNCWSLTTIVTNLPPSRIAGPVLVTFEGFPMPGSQVFSYYDDTDRELIALALQVVGLKMNGRLEDARDIARRIVGSGTGFDATNVQQFQSMAGSTNRATSIPLNDLENLLLKCLDLVDLYTSDHTPNWQLSNSEGQTMLHLAACLGLHRFAEALLDRSGRLDIQDKNGFTALHFAGLHQHNDIVSLFLERGADPQQRTYTGETHVQLNESDCAIASVSSHSFAFNGDSEHHSFVFNGDSDSDSDSDSNSDSDGDSSSEDDKGAPDVVENKMTRTRRLRVMTRAESFRAYFESWRESAVFGKTAFGDEDTDMNLWDLIYPNTGDLLKDDDDDNCTVVSSGTVQAPPSYADIFPAGASSSADYSGAAIDEEKQKVAVSEEVALEVPFAGEVEGPSSEEEVLEAWKNKRKKIQNDRMFLYFWLPVFIFILVWVSMKVLTVYATFDSSAHLHEKLTEVFKKLLGSRNKLNFIEPVVKGAKNKFLEHTQGVRIVEL